MYTEIYIGSRIKQRRSELGLTQMDLAKELSGPVEPGESLRAQIADWERPRSRKKPSLVSLIKLCNALDCDIDYLLGAIDTPRRATYDVVQETGLSSDAADIIIEIKQNDCNEVLDVLSSLLTNKKFWDALSNINYAKFASKGAEREMSDSLKQSLLELKLINGVERHPGAVTMNPSQMKDINLYHAAQKFSECAEQIANGSK